MENENKLKELDEQLYQIELKLSDDPDNKDLKRQRKNLKERIRVLSKKIESEKTVNEGSIITPKLFAEKNNITNKQACDKLWNLSKKGEYENIGWGQYRKL